MNHDGYTARIEFDEASGTFHGRVEGIRDIITFEGPSMEELKRAFQDSVDDYLAWAADEAFAPEQPVAG